MRCLVVAAVLLGLLGLLPPSSARADDDGKAGGSVALSVAGLKVRPVPRALRGAKRGFATFYERYTTLEGFTIQASQGPRDEALLEAAWIIRNMLAKRRDILDTLRWRGIRLSVMAHDEWTTNVPEHASLTPAKWWDYRARGLGPGPRRPVVTCAEENLLGFRGDPYAGESILIHEFGHAIDLEAMRYLERGFAAKLEAAYKAALAAGLWQGSYAATNKEEYWAEGVQSWFDANGGARSLPGGVDTREKLLAYDPRLGALLRKVFGNNPWRYVPAAKRLGRGHLRGCDPATLPTFRWPEGLADWYWAYEQKKATGEGLLVLEKLPAASAPKRSPVTRSETRVLFVNESGVDVRIYWLGYDGKRKPYGTLRAGASEERATLAFHVWVVTDDAGRELARFRAGKAAGRAVIRAPDATK
ncbi:MAG: hypothetical protein P1V36_17715 [Planctomycetota bacterium]|nr:hypothetical protein [Planctomycetota bacterium]